MKKIYLPLLLITLCTTLYAQDSLVGNWTTHYYKTEEKEIKCQDKFDIDKLVLRANGTYSKQYFTPQAPDDAPIQMSYDLQGKKKYYTPDGNELKLIRVKKIQEYGRYKIVSTTGHIEFTSNNQIYVKRIKRKGQSLMVFDTLDNKLFIRVYKKA